MSNRRLATGVDLARDQQRGILDAIDRINRILRLLRPGVATGTITLYGNATAPSEWVLCNGATYDGTTPQYIGLWNVIGTTFGGTGQPAFDVPNIAAVGSAVYIIKL